VSLVKRRNIKKTKNRTKNNTEAWNGAETHSEPEPELDLEFEFEP